MVSFVITMMMAIHVGAWDHDDCDGDDDDGEMMINRPGAAIRPLSLLLT